MNAELRGLADLIEAEVDKIDRMPSTTYRKLRKAIAALRSLSVAQGQGFVMVPRELPSEVVEAARFLTDDVWACDVDIIWEHIIEHYAAAPAQPDGVDG